MGPGHVGGLGLVVLEPLVRGDDGDGGVEDRAVALDHGHAQRLCRAAAADHVDVQVDRLEAGHAQVVAEEARGSGVGGLGARRPRRDGGDVAAHRPPDLPVPVQDRPVAPLPDPLDRGLLPEVPHVAIVAGGRVASPRFPAATVAAMSETEPIVGVIERWHAHLRGELPGGLDELLHDDVVFYSPIVFTPQEGKAITALYLQAAGQALPGEGGGTVDGGSVSGEGADERPAGAFRYTKKVLSGDTAVLEFETTVEGKYVNGVDIIRCDADGKIVEFRVMIRPLQAVNAVHQQMAATLERLQG